MTKQVKRGTAPTSASAEACEGTGFPAPAEVVREPARDVPVTYDVDVAVCGGGIAGMMAAIAAARHGARTVVIDRFGHLGGNMGPGYFAGGSLHFALQNDQDITVRKGLRGMLEEFLRRVMHARPTERGPDDSRGTAGRSDGFARAQLLYWPAVGPAMDGAIARAVRRIL